MNDSNTILEFRELFTRSIMNVLITNDDGVHAEGLLELKKALQNDANVFVIAPDRPRSACGHSITLHKPLRVEHIRLRDGSDAISCSGTPSDCVSLGLLGVVENPINLVVSGINKGPNLGWDLTYSGTVSAAMEGVISGVPSFAISVAGYDRQVEFTTAGKIAVLLMRALAQHALPDSTLLNVNVPNLPMNEIAGIEITRQGKRTYEGELQKRTDPFGRDYYWLGGELPVDHLEPGTDVNAVHCKRISVTPIHMDLTDHNVLDTLKSWKLKMPEAGNILPLS